MCLGTPDSQENPKSRAANSGLHYSYGVDCGTFWYIYLLYPFRGLVSSLEEPFKRESRVS